MIEKLFHGKGVTITSKGWMLDKVFKEISEQVVAVGIFDPEKAKIAAYNEYGTSTIPARPFLTTALAENRGEITKKTREVFVGAIKGGDLNSLSEGLGEDLAEMVKNSIQNGGWAPNAPSTIAKKGSSQPLIDTGEMMESVSYRITKR